MVLRIVALLLFVIPEPSSASATDFGPPAYSSSNRLALSLNGDIWVVHIPSAATSGDSADLPLNRAQITHGPAEDRDPVWMPDGKSLVFASDRNGTFDLWRVQVGPNGAAGDLQPFIHSDQSDRQPTVARDGTVVWVRGLGPDANLWIKKTDGKEEPLTEALGAEIMPAFSPDGLAVAYIRERKDAHQLRILNVSDRSDTLVVDELSPEYPRWSPAGDRLVFVSRGNQSGIWITTPAGRYKNLVSTLRGAAAWSPDGRHLVLLALPRRPPAYNGDPGQSAPRAYKTPLSQNPTLTFVSVPAQPETNLATVRLEAAPNRSTEYMERFDRVADYLTKRYDFDNGARRKAWRRLRQAQRETVAQAADPEAAEKAIYTLLRDRPTLREEVHGRAVVSSAHPLATQAGLDILKKGGNVVDAAVAISFALGVVEPDASGVGGYGEMLIFLEGMETPTCIEFLTRVPEAASLNNGALRPLPEDGPVLANVPGTAAGMELAWKCYGTQKVKWAQLVEPAVKLARDGFVLDEAFPTTLARGKERYLQYESTKKMFFPNDRRLQSGDLFRNPDLAWTLDRIAAGGAKAFYRGEIAKRLVRDLRGQGNVMTLEDLSRYYAVEREPVSTSYRGHTVYSGPPPVSGGAALVGKLNLLEQWLEPKAYREDAATLHSMIEAWKLAPPTRGQIADPGLWPVDLKPFTDKVKARERWQSCFDPQHSASPHNGKCLDDRMAVAWGAEGILDARPVSGTTAFVVADAEGNMVSVTQTLGTWGGNFYVTPGLGFIYNDKLRSYGSDPKRYNARIPFARNVTSIAPTLVFKGTGQTKQPFLAVGAAGNAWITSAVYQIVAGVLDQGLSPQQAIEQPRFLVAVRRNPENRQEVREIVVQVEDGFAPGVLDKLAEMGHEIQRISLRGELRMGYAAAAIVEGGTATAGADPRRSGQAGAVK